MFLSLSSSQEFWKCSMDILKGGHVVMVWPIPNPWPQDTTRWAAFRWGVPFLSRPFKLSLRKSVAVSMVLDHLGYLIHLVHEDVGRIQNEIGKVLLRRGYDGNMLYSITCCCLDFCSERIDSPMLCEGSVVQLLFGTESTWINHNQAHVTHINFLFG